MTTTTGAATSNVPFRTINHISPSSLSKYENQPNKFFMERVYDPGWPREESGLAANIGTGFDIFCKMFFSSKLGLVEGLKAKTGYSSLSGENKERYKDNLFRFLIDSHTGEQYREKAILEGSRIFGYYTKTLKDNESCSQLKESSDFYDIELSRQVYLPPFLGSRLSIPTYCKGDAAVKGKRKNLIATDVVDTDIILPFDWKVKGSGSKASPPPKYCVIFDELGVNKGQHKSYYNGIAMQDIDKDWATQLVFTGWQCGHPTYPEAMFPYDGIIHCLVCDSTTGKIRLAVYRGELSVYWQKEVLNRCQRMWRDLTSGDFYNRHRFIDLTSMAALEETWF